MQKVSKTTIKGRAITQLQNMKQAVVTGAAAAANIAVTGIKAGDAIIGSTNLTDLTDVIIAAVKASVAGLGVALDTVIEATVAGVAGNAITVALVGDATATVRITRVGNAFTIRYESGVSTVANVETAIAALAGGDDLIAVGTGGTGATVLTAPADNSVAEFLTGGADAFIEKPVATSDGNIQFATANTTGKKIQVLFAPSAV
jgi:hypothetical protein